MRTHASSLFSRTAASVALCAALAACDDDVVLAPLPPDEPWTWTDLGGPDARTPELVANHEPLVVVGAELLLATADGVWRRPLTGTAAWSRSGLDGRTVHALARTADGARVIAAGFDPRDERAPTVWFSTSDGADWIPAATWPRGAPGGPAAGVSFRFASLEPDPIHAHIAYGGLDGDTVAVTVDGGASWFMTNGATSPTFGYPCVMHRPRNAPVLLQGCELPLDVAWVGARDISEADRFTLGPLRYLFGYPELAELGNRRINAIASPAGRDDRVLVGVEGGLLELTSKDGRWGERPTITARWTYRSDGQDPTRPYAYIRAIAPLGAGGRHVLFGGTVNGVNEELSLFETHDGGATVRRIEPPFALDDPRVEQAVRIGTEDVLLVISSVDGQGRRSPRVYRLQR